MLAEERNSNHVKNIFNAVNEFFKIVQHEIWGKIYLTKHYPSNIVLKKIIILIIQKKEVMRKQMCTENYVNTKHIETVTNGMCISLDTQEKLEQIWKLALKENLLSFKNLELKIINVCKLKDYLKGKKKNLWIKIVTEQKLWSIMCKVNTINYLRKV